MKAATLARIKTGDSGTFGTLITDSGSRFHTGEIPYRDNAPEKSCIPPGSYICTWEKSPKFGFCYHVQKVVGRTHIEIHAANFMGDADKGLLCQLEGCIAVGKGVGKLKGQDALLSSAIALQELQEDMRYDPFALTILDATN